VFAVLLAVTGPHLASLYSASGITGCHGGSCGQLASTFLSQVGAGLYPVVYMLASRRRPRAPPSSASSGERR